MNVSQKFKVNLHIDSTMTVSNGTRPHLRVAIVGGGPGGLAAAIELSKLSFVEWQLYEKKPAISETGGGISMQRHTWRMLDLLGASKHLTPDDYFRPLDGHYVQHRLVSSVTILSGDN